MLNEYFIRNLLHLPDNFQLSFQQLDGQALNLVITQERRPHPCPSCGHITDRIHDYRLQSVSDIPLQKEAFHLLFRKRRYVCPQCGKRFFEENGFLSRYKRHTNRFRLQVFSALSEMRSISNIADEFFCSDATIRRILLDIHYPKPAKLPSVLAIDEFRGNMGEKFQCILADPQHKTVLDVLPGRNSEDLYAYFSQYPMKQRKRVRYIVMDMSSFFRSVMHSCFPRAKIIADKFHVVRLIDWAMEAVRKKEQKKFDSGRRKYFKHSKRLLLKHRRELTDEEKEQVALMLNVSEKIRQAYALKELFYDMMDSRTKIEIKARYKLFLTKAETFQLEEFLKHLPTLREWFQEIMRGILIGYNNGFIEGCNNRTKVLKRISYGIRNFRVGRTRILHIAHNSAALCRKRSSRNNTRGETNMQSAPPLIMM